MGLMKEESILKFIKELAHSLKVILLEYEIEITNDMMFRYRDKKGLLSEIAGTDEIESCFTDAEESLEKFKEDEYIDIFFSCEGTVYEGLYSFENMGVEGFAEAVYKCFYEISKKHNVHWELCGGAVSFAHSDTLTCQWRSYGWY